MNVVVAIGVLKRKALRRGLWFRTLNSAERAIVDLCLKVKQGMDVKSPRLLRVLMEIAKKIIRALKSPSRVEAWIRGFKAALMLSRIAVSWGYEKAKEWARDLNFITFLAKAWVQDVPFNML